MVRVLQIVRIVIIVQAGLGKRTISAIDSANARTHETVKSVADGIGGRLSKTTQLGLGVSAVRGDVQG